MDRLTEKGNVEGILNFLKWCKESDNITNFELDTDVTLNGIECKYKEEGEDMTNYI